MSQRAAADSICVGAVVNGGFNGEGSREREW